MEDLDRQVAEALGYPVVMMEVSNKKIICHATIPPLRGFMEFTPSTNGQQAMDLLKNHHFTIESNMSDKWYVGYVIEDSEGEPHWEGVEGPTPEIAICKAVIASKEGK
jgi:hypothetical protein